MGTRARLVTSIFACLAAALLGGFTASCQGDDGAVTSQAWAWPDHLQFVVATPDVPLDTAKARAVLPHAIPRRDAIFNIQRVVRLLRALETGQDDQLREAFRDRLHQPYRAKLVRGMDALFQAARRAGAHGVALSGSGPSIIAFADCRAEEIAQAMQDAAARLHLPGKTHIARASARGASVSRRP